MFSWEWENFDSIIQSSPDLTVDDHGPLKGPVYKVSINRDADLNLVMTTQAHPDAKGRDVFHPPGTVRENTDAVTFSNNRGLQLVAEGVHVGNTRIHHQGLAPGKLEQDCSISHLKGKLFTTDNEVAYVIDWLDNVPSEFEWPDMVEDKIEGKTTRIFGVGLNRPMMTGQNQSEGSSWSCVHLTVDGCTLFFCWTRDGVAEHVKKPGYILYIGNPSDEFRDRLRECLSFALGVYLVYLGNSSFSKAWWLIHFEAVSAYSLAGRAYRLPPQPPSPLGLRHKWEINREVFSRMVNAFYNHYDALDFGTVSWAYWHAVAASPHIAGVHFGAALELLERAYLKSNESKAKQSLLTKEEWKVLRPALEKCVKDAVADVSTKTLLTNKISSLNSAPQSIVTDNLLHSLGLPLGPRESIALRLRNISAHGKDDEVGIEWIRDLKILRLRFHRMILAMTNANDSYYDYFTIHHPIRKVVDPIPSDDLQR